MKYIPVRNIKTEQPNDQLGQIRVHRLEVLMEGEELRHTLHRHDFYFVLLISSGGGTHVIDFTSYKVQNHSLYFIRPGQVHELSLTKGTKGFLLEFSSDYMHSKHKKTSLMLRRIGRQNLYSLTSAAHEKINQYCESILEEIHLKALNYQDALRANLQLLLLEIYRQGTPEDKPQNQISGYQQEQLDVLLELLETHIRSAKQVKDYAEMMHLTPYQLNHITKSLLDKTCSELISDQLILEAKRLLIVTTNQINEVADALGFGDSSYFIRFFKKATGYTPAVFVENFK